jgi:hypothetical protein
MNDDELSLFDLDEPDSPNGPMPIRLDQISEIRQAFEVAGIQGQQERKALIESVVIREVSGLRDLQALEARRILTRIESSQSSRPSSGGSAWDNRDEDTWIDKL